MTFTDTSEMTWQSELFAGRTASVADATATALSPDRRRRLSPRAAFQELLFERALLVDIRPRDQRAIEGEIAPALHRGPIVASGRRLILLCQDGRVSSRAADSLVGLGVHHTTDVVGGFAAWRSLGLPVRDRPPPHPGRR